MKKIIAKWDESDRFSFQKETYAIRKRLMMHEIHVIKCIGDAKKLVCCYFQIY